MAQRHRIFDFQRVILDSDVTEETPVADTVAEPKKRRVNGRTVTVHRHRLGFRTLRQKSEPAAIQGEAAPCIRQITGCGASFTPAGSDTEIHSLQTTAGR
jgi:hypothetical protein